MTMPLPVTLGKAVAATGGRAEFCRVLGIRARTLRAWRDQGVPENRWHEVERATRGEVTRVELALERAHLLDPPA